MQRNTLNHRPQFIPARDSHNRRVPGLCIRNERYYAQLWVKDLALDQLGRVERVPNLVSYGYLKLQPIWDPLRGEPRFENLLASLVPKD